MIKKTLYFGHPAYLSLSNGQLVVRMPEVEQSSDVVADIIREESRRTLPLEDIGVMVLDHQRITLTQGLLDALLEKSVALVTCNQKSMPIGLFLPLEGNTLQGERSRFQIEASLPLKKQLWQQTVRAKIENQSGVLEKQWGRPDPRMIRLAESVKSNDSDNHEAQAAAYYWKNVFRNHPDFIRDRNGLPPNHWLNYGYAILRAVVARALVVSGLLPVLGIHHHNRYNAYPLADDVMEPYRPYVDNLVVQLLELFGDAEGFSLEVKRHLLGIPAIDVVIGQKRTPLMVAVSQTTASLAKCFSGESRKIVYPVFPCSKV